MEGCFAGATIWNLPPVGPFNPSLPPLRLRGGEVGLRLIEDTIGFPPRLCRERIYAFLAALE